MLVEVFGSGNVYSGLSGTVFVAGSLSSDQLAVNQLTVWQPDPAAEDLPLATDNWPYLYLRARAVPGAYWQALLLIGAVCLALLGRSFPQALRPNWRFWLLGAAFLLVEFKSITDLALLLDTTWLVNALAISGVLLMTLGANLVVPLLRRLDLGLIYALLFASLVFSYFLPLDVLVSFSPTVRALGGTIMLSLPLFFCRAYLRRIAAQGRGNGRAAGL